MRRLFAPLIAAVLTAGACGSSEDDSGTLHVFAAASLTEAFEKIGKRFETANPGTAVSFNFGASSTLARQIRDAAPADVLATADDASMREVLDADLAEDAEVFAVNRLAILVAKGNPKKVTGLADLSNPVLSLVVCAAEVPCGKLATRALANAGVTVRPVSFEANVKAVVSKVLLGEADAGIVYVTDIRAVGDKGHGVDVPPAHNVATTYLIAELNSSDGGRLAEAFVDFVLAAEGRRVLRSAGFDTS